MDNLTEKQQSILKFIDSYIQSKGYPPTIREIGQGVSSSIASTHWQMEILEDKGYLEIAHKRQRAIKVLKIA
jgi:repressor LexA